MNCRPLLIAELSASHLGSLPRARELVEAAADAGADCIKTQCWTPELMVLDPDYTIQSGPWAGRLAADLYREAWTPWDWHAELFELARSKGMFGFSAVFDLPSLAFLESIDCPIYKISSFELTDLGLIVAAARTGKPLILSTGMATASEIDAAYYTAEKLVSANFITLLKCTSAYPARAQDANLSTIADMRRRYRCDVGLSDHTTGAAVSIAAAALGAAMIERHFTLARADGGPDAAFSLEPAEFKAMADACRQAAAAVGTVQYGGTDAEAPQRALRRSLHFFDPQVAGHRIAPHDVASARPGDGLPPMFAAAIIGRTLAVDVKKGDPVTWDRLEGVADARLDRPGSHP